MVLVRRMIDKRTGADVVLDEIRREVGAILTEMNQTTERNIELIEDRVSTLKAVLEKADRKLTVLQRESSRQDNAEKLYSRLSRSVPVTAEPADVVAGAAPLSQPPTDNGEKRAVQAEAAVREESEDPKPDLKSEVLRLYRRGIAFERIASRVGTAVSEVELIVSLSERQ